MADARIIIAAVRGELGLLQGMAANSGGAEAFRRKCEMINDCLGWTALHHAAGRGSIEICRFLIEQVKVKVDLKTENGSSPLLLAVDNGHTVVAKYLIIRGADIAVSDSEGITPLHHAAKKCNKELMQLLLLKGANIEAKSVHGTPIQKAISFKNVESVRFLLARGASPNAVSVLCAPPLILAISSRSSELFEMLLRAGADPNLGSSDITPLAYAAKWGVVKFLSPLLQAGANPNLTSTAQLAPIEYAASSFKLKAVRILFPVTRRIPSYPSWSTVNQIFYYFHSDRARRQREEMKSERLKLLEQKGRDAMERSDFQKAIEWLSAAISLVSSDATLFYDRSICFLQIDEGVFALSDAKACIRLKPQWARAHYIEGLAWWKLNFYKMASNAYRKASQLDPDDAEISNAFRVATAVASVEIYQKYPAEFGRVVDSWGDCEVARFVRFHR